MNQLRTVFLVCAFVFCIGCDKPNRTTLAIEPRSVPDAVIANAAQEDIAVLGEIFQAVADQYQLGSDRNPLKQGTFFALLGNIKGEQLGFNARREGRRILIDISSLRPGPASGKTELFEGFESQLLSRLKERFGSRITILESY